MTPRRAAWRGCRPSRGRGPRRLWRRRKGGRRAPRPASTAAAAPGPDQPRDPTPRRLGPCAPGSHAVAFNGAGRGAAGMDPRAARRAGHRAAAHGGGLPLRAGDRPADGGLRRALEAGRPPALRGALSQRGGRRPLLAAQRARAARTTWRSRAISSTRWWPRAASIPGGCTPPASPTAGAWPPAWAASSAIALPPSRPWRATRRWMPAGPTAPSRCSRSTAPRTRWSPTEGGARATPAASPPTCGAG